jgi:uncharacterized membrane protein YjgN (DUF898 family)
MSANAATVQATPAVDSEVPFEFTGTSREYFGIWIVNTLFTLGGCSPWAKVRALRYFYRSTRLLGSSFDDTGDPLQIPRGRVIVAALLLVLLCFRRIRWLPPRA